MYLYKNLSEILTLENAFKKGGRNLLPEDMSILKNASIAFDLDRIHWIGELTDLPQNLKIEKEFDLEGHSLTPEIVDSHTHLVFGGDRANEYMMRLNGADYQQIAEAGGGILNTMQATRSSSHKELFEMGKKRVESYVAIGIRTIEVKSGYGLDTESEYKLSSVISSLRDYFKPLGIRIIRTFMAAHAVPKEFSSSNEYLDQIVLPLMIKLNEEKMIDFVDIFHEEGYFTENDTRKLFEKARALGLSLKIHADEFGDNGGAELALEYGATSCDHLLKTNRETIKKFSTSDTVATILPGTSMFLGKDFANISDFLSSGAIVSFASDYNPGSCHSYNLINTISTAAPRLNINSAQLWAGITLNAAKSLGLKSQGSLLPSHRPRFSLFKVPSVAHITYHWGENFSCELPVITNA